MIDLMELLKRKSEIEKHIEQLKLALSETTEDIENFVSEPLIEKRKFTGADTGTVKVLVNGVVITQTIPKTVVWDQDILKSVYAKIKEFNDNPDNYIDTKFSVAEKKYSAFPDGIRKQFDPARTVKAGKPKLTFKIEGEV